MIQNNLTLNNKIRFVTAASLFDGHDAAIHIMRRILQSEGAEVIHLGHNRSVQEVVDAAIQEDVQGIAVSSYQGGHLEYFSYMLELLKKNGAGHIKVFGGGGGVIVPEEIELLHARGITRIFSPHDGQVLGLVGMINFMLQTCDHLPGELISSLPEILSPVDVNVIARGITTLELDQEENTVAESKDAADSLKADIATRMKEKTLCPVIGITGTGGAGKSSLIDETLLRFLSAFPEKRVAVLSVDPTRKRTGGALLGDRIRMNSARNPRVYIRSMATRRANLSTSATVKDALALLKVANYDVVILETAGIGQSDSEVTDLADICVYVMTPEYGASSQLEKIDMLDFADLIAINKFDKRGALDALRDVRKTYQRNKKLFDQDVSTMPVFATSAHHFNDQGTNRFFNALFQLVGKRCSEQDNWNFDQLPEGDPDVHCIIPISRARYLSEISDQIRHYHDKLEDDAEAADKAQACSVALAEMHARKSTDKDMKSINELATELMQGLSPEIKKNIEKFNKIHVNYESKTHKYTVRGKTFEVNNFETSLSHQPIPKIALPHLKSWGDQLRFMQLENLPGYFPYTAGVFPFKRQGEDPARMFAGEGMPERTNKRFHYLSLEQAAKRLSTAFDSTTLYGADPDLRPDIYGKIGNAGVSVCSLDDAKRLYSGFNLCLPNTSVSMTINGPAPTILAFFLNAAIDAACERELKAKGKWPATEEKIFEWFALRGMARPIYRAQDLPQGHDGMGLGFLGLPADVVVDAKLYQKIKSEVLQAIRGTVQADILKEDQAQNTCIFSTEFALRMMGDVQQYFIENNVRNFYSVSISGYHIAEAGANPVTQLALTLANGFTLVEYYRARGMDINAFAPNLSFFFSNGLDPEYSVIGRVARRIWAIAMRDLYQADDRSQKLKYHIQTSGRSLHAQEINFNDIRTTLQALYAIMDNCNSLHTNAYDEAITTPTEESVRRALAIQLIIYRELGLSKNENPWQGSYFIEYMTNLVEEAVLKEFEALDSRGGVLGAMETMYQRSKIQEESMYYENKKMNGELPIIGVNTFINDLSHQEAVKTDLIRSSTEEKDWQVEQVKDLAKLWEKESTQAIEALKKAAISGENIFTELMETSKHCTLGVITEALYKVGGAYRRGM